MRSSSVTRSALILGCSVLLNACSDDAKQPSDARDAGDRRDAGAVAHRADASMDGGVACDVEAPHACSDPDLRYDDVKPIIERRCLACHDGSTEQWPLISYSHVASWYDQIRSMMLTCSMPPPDSGMTMTIEERETLLLWIRCGFPN